MLPYLKYARRVTLQTYTHKHTEGIVIPESQAMYNVAPVQCIGPLLISSAVEVSQRNDLKVKFIKVKLIGEATGHTVAGCQVVMFLWLHHA